MVVGFTLIFEGQASVRDVVKILEPLKVRDCHTTSVNIQIRDDQNVALNKDLVSGRSRWSVSGLSDNLLKKITI